MVQIQFDANSVKPLGEYEVFPEGWYKAYIKESAAKETAKKDGQFLQIGFQLIEGDFNGGAVGNNLNLWNKNEKAREIAFRELSSICHVTGVMQLQDTSQLHNIPFWIRLAIEEGTLKDDNTGYYPDKNVIKAYKHANEVVPATPTRADQVAMMERAAKRDADRKNASPAGGAQQGGWQPPAQAWQPPAQQAAQAPTQAPAPVQQPAATPAPVQQPAATPAAGAPPWAQQQVPNGQQAAANIAPQTQAPAPQAAPPAQQSAAPAGVPPWAQQSAGGAGAPPWAQQTQG